MDSHGLKSCGGGNGEEAAAVNRPQEDAAVCTDLYWVRTEAPGSIPNIAPSLLPVNSLVS